MSTWRSAPVVIKLGDAETVYSGILSCYLSSDFLLLQPFSTLSIQPSTVWQGTIVHHYPEDNKMRQDSLSFLSFHMWTLSKCGYSQTDSSNTVSNTWIYMVQVSLKIYFTPFGRHTLGIYRCSSTNGRAAFIVPCFGLQHLQQAAAGSLTPLFTQACPEKPFFPDESVDF